MICTNPSRNKKKNTINNHKKGHQQHENKGNLFRISNIAENVVAHVRINGQILKDVKSLRRVGSDSSVLCFFGAARLRGGRSLRRSRLER